MAARWAKFKRDEDFKLLLTQIAHQPHLSRAMRGAAIALIT